MLPLYEVDGQNRLGGLRRALDEDDTGTVADYPIPVTFLDDVRRITEAITFYIINTEQKLVPTDIAQRLIAQQVDDEQSRDRVLAEGKEWIAKGTHRRNCQRTGTSVVLKDWYSRRKSQSHYSPGIIHPVT
jgi:hypothetical protein